MFLQQTKTPQTITGDVTSMPLGPCSPPGNVIRRLGRFIDPNDSVVSTYLGATEICDAENLIPLSPRTKRLN